jgi:protein TonB
MVSLIAPPALTAPPVPPQQPKAILKPHPQLVQKPVEPQPMIAAPADAPPAFVAPPPEPKPAPPVETTAQPEPAPPVPITPPRFNADYLQNPAPPYPPLARRMGEQGKVVLRVLVSVEGIAERVELKSSSGSSRLDQSALTTVKGWRFVPARQGEQKLAAWVLVPIVFTLEG